MKFSELPLLRWMMHVNVGATLALLPVLLSASTPVAAQLARHSLKPVAAGYDLK